MINFRSMRLVGKKWFLVAGVAIAYCSWAIFRPLPPIHYSLTAPITHAQAVRLLWPHQGEAVLAVKGYGVLAENGANKARPIASTAKLLTALTILKKYPLQGGQAGPNITFGPTDVAIYNKYLNEDGSVVPVKAGEQISEYQALQALLLPSANNIAYSLAIWAYGSMNKFLLAANSYALSLELNSTHMADASGFSPLTVSSAYDLTQLGLKITDNPILSKIVSQKSATFPLAGNIKNVNWFLGSNGINGIKTGNTTQAGGCYVFSAQHLVSGQPLTIVGAIVGDKDLPTALTDGYNLIGSVDSNFSNVELIKSGQSVGLLTSDWGANSQILAKDSLSALAWKGNNIQANLKITKISGRVKQNQNIGVAFFSTGDRTSSVDLVSSVAIAPPSIVWRLTHPY